MWYRVPFFKLLNDHLNVRFVFTDIELSSSAHGGSHEKDLRRLQDADVVICKKVFSNLSKYLPEGIPIDLLRYLLFAHYDILVDIVQSTAIFSLLAAKIRKKPLILWLGFWSLPNTRFFRLKLAITKLIVRRPAALLVYGSKHREAAIRWGADPQRVFIMPNVSYIERDFVRPGDIDSLKRKYATLDQAQKHGIFDKKIILFVGKLIRRKGVDYLIKAFSLLKRERDNVALFIVGGGSEEDNLVQLVKELSISDSIFFFGRIEQTDLPFFFSSAAVCVVPSVTLDDAEWGIHTEPWGLVLNEAMQFGKPIIATDAVGAAYDLVRTGKNGFVVPQKDEKALFESLKIILDDDDLRLRMGEESTKLIEANFRYEDMLKSFCAALDYVCGNSNLQALN
jgi:glycosyltransferase involved in cell wall biosynthesis